jgi:Ca2+-transporting ATPase
MALTILSLCNDAVLQRSEGDSWEAVGDPTEIALQVLSHKLGIEKDQLEEKWEFIEGLPFDSERKRMSVIHRNPEKEVLVLTKGAPEEVIDVCTMVREQGQAVELTEEKRARFKQINIDMAERGLRVLGIAYSAPEQLNDDIEPESVERDMILVGMVGVLDPARPEAKKAVEECRKAGIEVMMITGDHPATAVNIATGLGFFDQSRDKVMTGEELDTLSEDQLIALTPFPKVFARVSPENKLMLINALRKMKYVVAMTGDGVNDAAAIKHANVGVAMGKEGTDVTRQAADIVLSDDNFATIVSAVEEGRRIFTNVRKFIRYLLSCNVSNVFSILFAIVAGIPLPFTPIQILWLNLVTDTPPALALGFDQLEKNAMEKPPRDTKKGVFRLADVLFIIYHGAVMAALMLCVFLFEVYLNQTSIEKARTMAFAMLVLVQLTQAFNARSTASSLFRKDIFSNKSLIAGVATSFGLLIVGMYFPFLSGVFEQVSLNLHDWSKLLIGVAIFIFATELFKLMRRKFFPDSLNI